MTWSGSDNESGNDGLGLAVDAVSATDTLAVNASSSLRDLVKCASASKTELRFGPEALCHGAASLPIEAADLEAVGRRAHLHEGESTTSTSSPCSAPTQAPCSSTPPARRPSPPRCARTSRIAAPCSS